MTMTLEPATQVGQHTEPTPRAAVPAPIVHGPKTPAAAVFKIVWGAAGFIAGFFLVAIFGFVFLGPLAIAPLLIYPFATVMGGRRAARGQRAGWASMLGIILFTGLLPGLVGLFGVIMFVQGRAFFSRRTEQQPQAPAGACDTPADAPTQVQP